MRYGSIDEVLQSPVLTWEELCKRAEKETMIKGRREDYRKLQAKQKMMREKLRWNTTMTAPPFHGKTAMIEKTNEESESEAGTGTMEKQNEESVIFEEDKQMDSAKDEIPLQSEAKES
ncbi:hypothetical protein HG530_015855 [Fusarium avenaceum]|nr:hypothetical protein HG530_015855 [Fusarium avenaceum]